jgi:GNAT superfamily N-acetyltransferase
MSAGTCCDESEFAHALYLPGGECVMVWPAGPQDAEGIQAYIRHLSPASRHNRFLGSLSELLPAELHRMTHADGWSQGTLIAELAAEGGWIMVGEARYAVAADRLGCEIAVSVAEAWRRRGLATRLLANLARRAKTLRVHYLFGDVSRSNEAMQALARKAGFGMSAPIADVRLVRITKELLPAPISDADFMLPESERAAQSWSIAV